ncbi:hypothetical protein, partial [Chitinophaga sp.]|uniref:hypothetical protein n=1 Tax=Chitinophaga sp. TaxID=1869181 RepID=UPI00263A12FF
CHGGGRGFESRPVRKSSQKPALSAGFLFLVEYLVEFHYVFNDLCISKGYMVLKFEDTRWSTI